MKLHTEAYNPEYCRYHNQHTSNMLFKRALQASVRFFKSNGNLETVQGLMSLLDKTRCK